MQVVYGGPYEESAAAIGNWFSEKTKSPVHPPFSAIGWVADQELCGAVLFHDFNGSNMEMHVWVTDNKMTRQMIRDVFEYVFTRANCNRLTVKPYRKNKPARAIVERFGFVYEATLKNYYGLGKGNDAIVYRLDRVTAERWLNGSDRNSATAAAA